MFASHLAQPRQSKRSMVQALPAPPAAARLAARNTLDYTTAEGVRVIRLHSTDILTIHPSGAFIVNTGGWNTTTTRARLNSFLPAPWRVFTHKGVAHLSPGFGSGAAAPVPFRNTITVNKHGLAVSDMKPGADKKLVGLVDAYMKAFKAKGLPSAAESGGDPWVFGSHKVGQNVMLDWLKSRYVHRRMLTLALEYCGTPPAGIGYYLHQCDRNGGKMDRLLTSRIRRYIRACIGLEA